MQVRVKYFAALREITCRSDDTLHLQKDSSAEDAVNLLCKTYGEKLSNYLLNGKGRLRDVFQVIVNGSTVKRTNLDERRLKDGDTFIILPPVAGG